MHRVQLGFSDYSDRLESLHALGDPLKKILEVVDFELFREVLENGLQLKEGGRRPYDAVLIFKMLIIQSLYTLSDDSLEYQVRDRLSFMEFLGLSLADKVPDAKTIWLYRERLKEKGLTEVLFSQFNEVLKSRGYVARGGQIVDASIVQAPRQRLSEAEKMDVKSGRTPCDWELRPSKKRQKDKDARWMVKYSKARGSSDAIDLGVPYYGYKNHISCDADHGFVRRYKVTGANKYDGHVLPELLDHENLSKEVWGDSAYDTEQNLEDMKARGFKSRLHFKPCRKVKSQEDGVAKSRIRSRVEHIFGVQKCRMKLFVRTIGLARAAIKIGFANLAYNMSRLVFVERRAMALGALRP